MENRILAIRFGDNDFSSSLERLGEYILNDLGEMFSKEIYDRNPQEFNNILTHLFRCFLNLYQHRFDMYSKWSSKELLFDKINIYNTSDYFIIDDTEFISSYENECDNSETLIIDFINRSVQIV